MIRVLGILLQRPSTCLTIEKFSYRDAVLLRRTLHHRGNGDRPAIQVNVPKAMFHLIHSLGLHGFRSLKLTSSLEGQLRLV